MGILSTIQPPSDMPLVHTVHKGINYCKRVLDLLSSTDTLMKALISYTDTLMEALISSTGTSDGGLGKFNWYL